MTSSVSADPRQRRSGRLAPAIPGVDNHRRTAPRFHLCQSGRLAACLLAAICVALLLLGARGFHVHASNQVTAPAELTTPVAPAAVRGDLPFEGEDEPQLIIEAKVLQIYPNPHDDEADHWHVRSTTGTAYWIYMDDDTTFVPRVAVKGEQVRIEASWELHLDQHLLVASSVNVISNSGDNDENLEGLLISVGVEAVDIWVIQVGLQQTAQVRVDQTTPIEGEPVVGTWVEIEGSWGSGNVYEASRVRNDTHEESEVVVRLATGVVSQTVASRYGLVASSTLLASGNIHLFLTEQEAENRAIEELTADADVLWAELNFTGGIPERHGYKTWRWGGSNDNGYVNQYAFEQVNVGNAHTFHKGENTVIAILDTGIALEHRAFRGRLLPGYDMIDDDAVPNDDGDGMGWGHGTHIAGIIAKMSPQSKLLPVRVLDTNGRGNTFALAYAIEWAVAEGADVINLSLGADANSQVLRNAVEHALEQNVVVVAAAGNLNSNTPRFPASFPGVIGVTAVDNDNSKAEFAAYGEGWVDLAAPGVGITSTIIGPQGLGYASWSGTSMATGFVSGAATLLRQQRPNERVELLAAQLIAYTTSVDGQNPEYQGELGGLLNVARALEVEPAKATITPAPTATPMPTAMATPSATPPPTATPMVEPMPPLPLATSQPEEQSAARLYLPIVVR